MPQDASCTGQLVCSAYNYTQHTPVQSLGQTSNHTKLHLKLLQL